MIRMTRYDGNAVFGVSFNLYGYEYIDFDKTSDALVAMVEDMGEEINERLNPIGLKFTGAFWYSPARYNFACDSVDPEIVIIDADKYIDFVERNREEIQKMLDANHSYDGFFSHTVPTVDEEIANIEAGKAPDILPITLALKDVIVEDDVDVHLVFQPEEWEA